MKALIAGGKGQLGREFRESLENYGYEVVALDKESLDISDTESVTNALSRHTPDVVLNCAAYNFVDRAEGDFDTACRVNAFGVKNLAAACKKNNALLVHYGSDYVFDGAKEDLYTEEDEPAPINAYGKSKLLGENFLKEEMENFLLFRVSWVFGDGKQNFLYKLLEWAKKTGTLKVVCDQISIPTYTKDIVSLTVLAVSKGLRGLYHLTNGGYASRYEVARFFLERMGLGNLILPVGSDRFPSPAQRPYFSAMSNLKLSRALDVRIPEWKVGVERYVETMFEKEEI